MAPATNPSRIAAMKLPTSMSPPVGRRELTWETDADGTPALRWWAMGAAVTVTDLARTVKG